MAQVETTTPEEPMTKNILNGWRCKKHPTYMAIRKPRIPCAGCWYLWFCAGKKAENIINTMTQEIDR